MLLGLLASPNICSRRWIWEQYDHQVMLNTVVLPGSDAAVLRIGDEGRGIAVSSDCNGRYCYLDPYVGAQIAFAEAARNVSCAGGDPAAITDCLNFGSPEKPEVFWTFYESVRGLSDACKAFGVPVISGNVSFYNESFGQPIYPTPTVGHGRPHGRRARSTPPSRSRTRATSSCWWASRCAELGGSEYLKVEHGLVSGRPPALDLELERDVQAAVRDAIRAVLVKSAHDCSEGGIAVALAESCLAGEHRRRRAPRGRPRARSPRSSARPRAASSSPSRTPTPRSSSSISSRATCPTASSAPWAGSASTICEKLDLSLDDLAEAFEPTLAALVAGEVQTEELHEG